MEPFLNTGTTFSTFSLSGNTPEINALLIIFLKGAIIYAHLLINEIGISMYLHDTLLAMLLVTHSISISFVGNKKKRNDY